MRPVNRRANRMPVAVTSTTTPPTSAMKPSRYERGSELRTRSMRWLSSSTRPTSRC